MYSNRFVCLGIHPPSLPSSYKGPPVQYWHCRENWNWQMLRNRLRSERSVFSSCSCVFSVLLCCSVRPVPLHRPSYEVNNRKFLLLHVFFLANQKPWLLCSDHRVYLERSFKWGLQCTRGCVLGLLSCREEKVDLAVSLFSLTFSSYSGSVALLFF